MAGIKVAQWLDSGKRLVQPRHDVAMAASRSWYRRSRSAASCEAPKSDSGWNPSKVCIAPEKLIVRGATLCLAAA
jgi:hypothetical protein